MWVPTNPQTSALILVTFVSTNVPARARSDDHDHSLDDRMYIHLPLTVAAREGRKNLPDHRDRRPPPADS